MNHRAIAPALLLLLAASAPAFAQHSAATNQPIKPSKTAHSALNQAEKSAEKQSGLSKDQAQNLLLRKGFTWLARLHAEPGSVWVWQADATKDGRRVRVGIDYRGRVLVISRTDNPSCEAPAANLGIRNFGVGVRLSEGSACARP